MCSGMEVTHIALRQKLPHLQRIAFDLSPLHASWQIDRRQHQDRVLSGVRIDLPAHIAYFDDPADDEVAHLGHVARIERPDGDELVHSLDGARDGCHDLVHLDISPVAAIDGQREALKGRED